MNFLIEDLNELGKKQIRNARGKMKKSMEELGLGQLRNRVTTDGKVHFPSEKIQVRVGFKELIQRIVEKNPEQKQEILDGVSQYEKWMKNWNVSGVKISVFLGNDGNKVVLWIDNYVNKKLFYEFASDPVLKLKVQQILSENLPGEKGEEYRLKTMFGSEMTNKELWELVEYLNTLKNYHLNEFTQVLENDVLEVVESYREDIKNLKFEELLL